jgi:hypothetical protein
MDHPELPERTRSGRIASEIHQQASQLSDELLAMVHEVRDIIREASGLIDRLDARVRAGGE